MSQGVLDQKQSTGGGTFWGGKPNPAARGMRMLQAYRGSENNWKNVKGANE